MVIFRQITELGSGKESADEIARRTCNLKVKRTQTRQKSKFNDLRKARTPMRLTINDFRNVLGKEDDLTAILDGLRQK